MRGLLLILLVVGCGSQKVVEPNEITVSHVTYVILDAHTDFPYVSANISVTNSGSFLARALIDLRVFNSKGERIATVQRFVHNIKGDRQFTLLQVAFEVAKIELTENWPWTETVHFEPSPTKIDPPSRRAQVGAGQERTGGE